MARASTYLNFARDTEHAFEFYRTVFGGEFKNGIRRFRDIPAPPDAPSAAEADLDLVMHVELEILGGHSLMGTDAPESMGFNVRFGNNMSISLEPDSLMEAQALFDNLSAGGQVEMPLQPMFWGGHFGSLTDRFGVQWMLNLP